MSKYFPTFVFIAKSAVVHLFLAVAFSVYSILGSRPYCILFAECKAGVFFETYSSSIAFVVAGVFACIASVRVLKPLLKSEPTFTGTESIPVANLYNSYLLVPLWQREDSPNFQWPSHIEIESIANDA
jgi:hypothetical protein